MNPPDDRWKITHIDVPFSYAFRWLFKVTAAWFLVLLMIAIIPFLLYLFAGSSPLPHR